ncbi:RCC1/BLIP-II protein, partial [Aspergillus campestris IBT 28561]
EKEKPILTHAPTKRLDVYVFGSNCYGELGLGDATKKAEITGPVLNPKMPADGLGLVHIVSGGVHSAALTHDNRIMTWGVNDEGTLARDTKEDKKSVEAREDESEDEDEVTQNLKEATPGQVDASLFPEGTVFTQLEATDSATFALTQEGLVYGWGTFRGNSGKIGFFEPDKKIQEKPALIPGVDNVIKLAAGAQHMLALTASGLVYTWGCEEQFQLGRRLLGRVTSANPLHPGLCALPTKIVDIGAGSYHSFAVRQNGAVYGWGSNNFGQTGIAARAGESDAVVQYPTEVKPLRKHAAGAVTAVEGGKDHSLVVTEQGKCLIWGRIDNKALGLDPATMAEEDVVQDDLGRARILKTPTLLPGIEGQIASVASGPDHSFAITKAGLAYSWGFNTNYQAGQPHRDGNEDVERPTLLQNKHITGKKILFAATGGQFGMLAGEHGHPVVDSPQTNGA